MKSNVTKHSRSPLRIYFLLMTLVGIIGTLVSAGMLIYAVGKKAIITNDEYIIGERYYELDTCNSSVYDAKGMVTSKPKKEEIATCKEEKKAQLIAARNALFKEDLLSGGIWTLLFLILLLTHYPRFMRVNKQD